MEETNDNKPKRRKTGGRKKGTPNKINSGLRDKIAGFLDNNFDDAMNEWKKIKDPAQKVRTFCDLMKYAVPTLQSVSLDAIIEKKADDIENKLKELSEEC